MSTVLEVTLQTKLASNSRDSPVSADMSAVIQGLCYHHLAFMHFLPELLEITPKFGESLYSLCTSPFQGMSTTNIISQPVGSFSLFSEHRKVKILNFE